MGYTTEFKGRFNLSRRLTTKEYSELQNFLCSQHDDRDGGMPSVWCGWRVTSDKMGIEWDKKEKFYEYVTWLQMIIDDYLLEWNVRMQGRVAYWGGRGFDDCGTIIVENSVIVVKKGFIDLQTTTLVLPFEALEMGSKVYT